MISDELVQKQLLELVRHDRDAFNFINSLWDFVVVWDDAVDQDKARLPDFINKSMMWALFGLKHNAFYQRWESALEPALQVMVASWMVSNKFARSGDLAKVEQAYFLRCSPYDVFALAVLLAGGFENSLKAVELFRSFAPEDTLQSFVKEHLGA